MIIEIEGVVGYAIVIGIFIEAIVGAVFLLSNIDKIVKWIMKKLVWEQTDKEAVEYEEYETMNFIKKRIKKK